MKKSIIPLAIVVSVVVLLSALLLPEQKQSDTANDYAFAELRSKAAQVDRITIENADGTLLAAKKQGSNWLATHFEGYPVATQSLSELLQTLVQAKNVEPKTAREDRYVRLGVEPVTEPNATSVLVSLYSGATKVMSVLVGNSAANGNAYIRKPTEKQSWLINSAISLPFSNTEWLAQPVLDVPVESVLSLAKLSLTQEQAEKAEWEISRANAGDEEGNNESDFTFSPMPEKATLKYPTVLQNGVNTLLSMEFEGLKPIAEPNPDAATAIYRITLTTGETLAVHLTEQENEKWLRFTSYVPPQQQEDESKRSLVLQPDHPVFKWQYRISDYNAGQWHKTPEDFFDLPEQDDSDAR